MLQALLRLALDLSWGHRKGKKDTPVKGDQKVDPTTVRLVPVGGQLVLSEPQLPPL